MRSKRNVVGLILLGLLVAGLGACNNGMVEEEEATPTPPPPLAITTTALPDATEAVAYNQNIQATGGTAPYVWSETTASFDAAGVGAAATPCEGLTFNVGATGLTTSVSGTPVNPGDCILTARIADSSNPALFDEQALGIGVDAVAPPAPSASVLSVDADIKQLLFSWTAADGATFYQLLEDPDGLSGFSQVGADLPEATLAAALDIAVHFHNWPDALYALDACNDGGCTRSNEVDTLAVMLDAIGYFKASNTEANDNFGGSVALSGNGNTLAVGARLESSNATGIDGNQADNSLLNSGAVYVFTRSGDTWMQEAYVKASNTEAGDQFGSSVALSGDGNTLAVSAGLEDSNATGVGGDQADNSAGSSGAVYVFTRSGSTWTQEAYVKASNTEAADNFGTDVALSGDGNTLAVGAFFEDSNATGIDGNQADNSLLNPGAVYVFTRSGTAWTQEAYVKASNTGTSDKFGGSVALSDDGSTLAVGAVEEDSAATGVGGDQADNSAGSSGAVYVFTRTGSTWTQEAYVKASNTGAGDQFGDSVALNDDGNTLAVGAITEQSAATGIDGDQTDNAADDSGAVYAFTRSGVTWTQEAYVKASNTGFGDQFGGSVALSSDGNTLGVGAISEDSAATGINGDETDNSADLSGAAYVFTRSGATWTQAAYVKASNTGAFDFFGVSVGLSDDGNTLAVGARNEASAATGIDGDQTDNSANSAGAVYIY